MAQAHLAKETIPKIGASKLGQAIRANSRQKNEQQFFNKRNQRPKTNMKEERGQKTQKIQQIPHFSRQEKNDSASYNKRSTYRFSVHRPSYKSKQNTFRIRNNYQVSKQKKSSMNILKSKGSSLKSQDFENLNITMEKEEINKRSNHSGSELDQAEMEEQPDRSKEPAT